MKNPMQLAMTRLTQTTRMTGTWGSNRIQNTENTAANRAFQISPKTMLRPGKGLIRRKKGIASNGWPEPPCRGSKIALDRSTVAMILPFLKSPDAAMLRAAGRESPLSGGGECLASPDATNRRAGGPKRHFAGRAAVAGARH